ARLHRRGGRRGARLSGAPPIPSRSRSPDIEGRACVGSPTTTSGGRSISRSTSDLRKRSSRWTNRPRTDVADPVRLIELRVLEGPNLYFTRPAIKLTLAVPGWLTASDERILAIAERLGVPGGARTG